MLSKEVDTKAAVKQLLLLKNRLHSEQVCIVVWLRFVTVLRGHADWHNTSLTEGQWVGKCSQRLSGGCQHACPACICMANDPSQCLRPCQVWAPSHECSMSIWGCTWVPLFPHWIWVSWLSSRWCQGPSVCWPGCTSPCRTTWGVTQHTGFRTVWPCVCSNHQWVSPHQPVRVFLLHFKYAVKESLSVLKHCLGICDGQCIIDMDHGEGHVSGSTADVTVLFPHHSILLFTHTRCLLTWRGRRHYINTSYLFIHTLSSFCFFDLSTDLANS